MRKTLRNPTIWMTAVCTAAAATVALAALTESAPARAAGPAAVVAQEQGLPMPWLRLVVGEAGAVLSGTVPNAIERDAVLAWARSQYPQLQSQLQVGEVANPNWLSTAHLPDLRQARRATALLSEAGLVIDGAVDAAPLLTRLNESIAVAQGRGLPVINRVVVQPQ
jgi:hypothetical protein